MNVIDSLGPVFLLIGFGAFLVKIGFLNREMLKGMNALAYWIGLPALIIYRLSSISLSGDDVGPLLAVFLAGTAVTVAAGLLAVRFMKIPTASTGTFIQASFRGNLAFIGLPVVIFAFNGIDGADPGRMQDLAVLSLAPIMILYNAGGVFALYASHAGSGLKLLVRTGRQVATNPLIIASVAGLLLAFSGLSFPLYLDRSVDALGRIALPLALLCIGGSLLIVPVKGSLSAAFAASLIKVAVAPLAGFGVGLALGIEPAVMMVAVIYLACPTAAASYVLAQQLGGDEALAASSIVISTVLSLASLTVAVGLL